MKAVTADGLTFEGTTPQAVVRRMKADDWSAPTKKREYMEEVAARILEITRFQIRTDAGALTFLHDLEQAGAVQLTDLTSDQAIQLHAITQLAVPPSASAE